MFQIRARAVVLAAAVASVTVISAATPSIGVAISDGNIRVNQAMTTGNTSVFDGTTLENDRPAQVRLKGGSSLNFGTSSRAQLFSDHVDLQQGSARFSGLFANANGLHISADSKSSANIELHGAVVQVAALTGSVHVFNGKGVNVANLLPGRALNLQDAGAAAASSMTGCVTKTGDLFTMMDETSNVTVQLRGGSGLRSGRRVTVTGTTVSGATPAGGATQVVAVSNVKDLGTACVSRAGTAGAAAGAGAGAAGAAAGGAAAGLSATTAVVAGVAAAAVGVGAGVAAGGSASGSGNGANGGSVNLACVGISPCTF